MKVFSIIDEEHNNSVWNGATTGESEKSTGSLLSFVFLVGLMLTCVLINSRIIFVVLINSKRTLRSVRKLVVQFSMISICYSILIFFEAVGKIEVRMMTTVSNEMCWVFSYFRHVIYGIFPLNAAVFVYERFAGPNTPFGKLVENKLIALIWIVSAFANIPQIFRSKYKLGIDKAIGHCTQVSIFESKIISLAYEVFQFLIFHAFVCLYMVACVYKISFKLRIIFKFERIRRIRMQRKSIRFLFVFLNTIAFVVLWLPVGFMRLGNTISQIYNEKGTPEHLNEIFLAFSTILQYILLFVSPVMYMLMNADLPPIFPGCILYQGNILAERHRDWRRMASRAQGNWKENSKDEKMAMFGVERGEMGMEGDDEEYSRPFELEEEVQNVGGNEIQSSPQFISPVCSIVEMEDYGLVVKVKENPETTLVLN